MSDQSEKTNSIELQFDPSKLTPELIQQIADSVIADLAEYQTSIQEFVEEENKIEQNAIEPQRIPIPGIKIPGFGKSYSKGGGHHKTFTKIG